MFLPVFLCNFKYLLPCSSVFFSDLTSALVSFFLFFCNSLSLYLSFSFLPLFFQSPYSNNYFSFSHLGIHPTYLFLFLHSSVWALRVSVSSYAFLNLLYTFCSSLSLFLSLSVSLPLSILPPSPLLSSLHSKLLIFQVF